MMLQSIQRFGPAPLYISSKSLFTRCKSRIHDQGEQELTPPYVSLKIRNFIAKPRYEDYDIIYAKKNRFEHLLGCGLTR